MTHATTHAMTDEMTGAMTPQTRCKAGLTLIEAMVSLFILSLLASASIGMIDYALKNNQALTESSETIKEFSIARALMKQDLSQIAARSARGVYGEQGRPMFWSGDPERGEPVLAFARLGWANPGGADPRGGAQYVEYWWEEGALVRRAYARIDPTQDTPVQSRVLVAKAGDVAVRFYARGGWLDEWRAPASFEPTRLPEAVELVFTSERYGEVRQLFITPQAG